jgi:hypothetical protein
VAKRRDSKYEPGMRSGAWLKMRINAGQELVIGGYTPSLKNFDALVIGYYDGPNLIYAARTRNGFTPTLPHQNALQNGSYCTCGLTTGVHNQQHLPAHTVPICFTRRRSGVRVPTRPPWNAFIFSQNCPKIKPFHDGRVGTRPSTECADRHLRPRQPPKLPEGSLGHRHPTS